MLKIVSNKPIQIDTGYYIAVSKNDNKRLVANLWRYGDYWSVNSDQFSPDMSLKKFLELYTVIGKIDLENNKVIEVSSNDWKV